VRHWPHPISGKRTRCYDGRHLRGQLAGSAWVQRVTLPGPRLARDGGAPRGCRAGHNRAKHLTIRPWSPSRSARVALRPVREPCTGQRHRQNPARAMRGTEPRRDLGRGHRCAPGRTRRPWAALVRCNAGRPPLRPLSGRSVGPAGFARRSSPTLTAADGGGSSVARFGPGVRLRGAAEIGGADASQASKSARRTRVRRPNFRATKRPARISS